MKLTPDQESDPRMVELANLASVKFDWHWAPLKIAGGDFKIATASDPDALLLDACERQDRGEQGVIDPFWAAVWKASAGLDQYLQRMDLNGTDVLELGCGTGRAGIAAALLGAKVVLTDGVDDPLILAEMSAWPIRDRCSVTRLRFGVDRLLDSGGSTRKFPLIIGSDVTYLRQLWPDVLKTAQEHLTDDGVLVLSDPHRLVVDEFLTWINRDKYNVNVLTEPIEGEPKSRPIRLIEIRMS